MIYLVEDDDNIRKLVSYALNKEGFETEGFGRPSEFWSRMDSVPELVLLDIMLPEEDGLSILGKLRNNPITKNVPVIMLTAKGSEYDRVNGLDQGADDYISKPFGMTELVSRVRALLRRVNMGTAGTRVYELGDLYVDPDKHIIKIANKDVNLSYKEYSLLIALLDAGGNVVSRDELLNRVWGEYYEESRTLDVHIRKLRVKLEGSNVQIMTIKSIGYKLERIENE